MEKLTALILVLGSDKLPSMDDKFLPIFKAVKEVREHGVAALPGVFDRFPLDLLQEFHDAVVKDAEYMAICGDTLGALGALQLHGHLCPYINAKLGTSEPDKTRAMQSKACDN